MTSGKWIVLDATTREVLGLFQDGGDAIQVRLSKCQNFSRHPSNHRGFSGC